MQREKWAYQSLNERPIVESEACQKWDQERQYNSWKR